MPGAAIPTAPWPWPRPAAGTGHSPHRRRFHHRGHRGKAAGVRALRSASSPIRRAIRNRERRNSAETRRKLEPPVCGCSPPPIFSPVWIGRSISCPKAFIGGADGPYPAYAGARHKLPLRWPHMAMDAGHLEAGEGAIAIGGSGRGADTAIVLGHAHSQHIFATDAGNSLYAPGPQGNGTMRGACFRWRWASDPAICC